MCRRDAADFGFGTVVEYMEEEGQKGDWFWKDSGERNPAPYRPKLSELVERVEQGEIKAVICYKTDRLVRSTEVMVALRRVFHEHGVKLIAQGRDCELETARGRYQNTIDSAVAEQWRDQISEDIKRDHDYKARNGFFSRNPSCLGFRSQGKESQAVNARWGELELVHRIHRMFVFGEDASGPIGISGICKRLMDEGISLSVGAKGHKAKNPKRIHTSQIKTILNNVMYIGRWRHNGEIYPCDRLLVSDPVTGELRTAIPISLFEASQARLRAAPARGKKSAYSDHLLSGIAVCGTCGRALHINNKRRSDGSTRHTFICARTRETIPCQREGMANIQEEQLDDWVLTQLAPYIEAEVAELQAESAVSDDRNRLADLRRQLSAARLVETDKLAAALSVLDAKQIEPLASRLRAERESLERRVADLESIVQAGHISPDVSLDLADMDRRAAKTALRSANRWIAVTEHGVVALTVWGTYVAGEFVASSPTKWNSAEARRAILPPSPASCALGVTWLARPETFLAGRRYVLGKQECLYLDDDLLPGIDELRQMEKKCA
jgi:hypothetical protein